MPGALTENAVDNLVIPFSLLVFIGITEVAGGIGLMVLAVIFARIAYERRAIVGELRNSLSR
ncbi:hypothetical protein [Nocardia higoensis]|uniref:hypothetical protein n=1 Tax=Nocardia higoensis TaxID=228599 RepID=UPI00030EB449|nr:hypothetical protein [Nocardia higoensis]